MATTKRGRPRKAEAEQKYLGDGEGNSMEPPRPPREITDLMVDYDEKKAEILRLREEMQEDRAEAGRLAREWFEEAGIEPHPIRYTNGEKPLVLKLVNKESVSITTEKAPKEDA